jgi:hypothetical protein
MIGKRTNAAIFDQALYFSHLPSSNECGTLHAKPLLIAMDGSVALNDCEGSTDRLLACNT